MLRQTVWSALSVAVLALVGCKGDPSSPQYWDKELNAAHHTKDRVRAIADLRESGKANASFLPMLHAHLGSDKQSEVRAALAQVLGDLKDPSSVGPLTDALEMGSTDSAGNAMNKEICGALAKIGDAKSTPALLRLLKSRDNYVRIEAINALGTLKAKEAVDPLLEIALDDQGERFISKKAIEALGNIADPKAVPTLVRMMFKERQGVSFYSESSFALFQIGRPASDALMDLVKGDDKSTWSWVKQNNILEPAVYAKAAQVLGDLHDSRAEATLLKNLTFNSEFLDLKLFVRMKAAEALGRVRAKTAVKPLAALLDEKEATARKEYVRALVMIGGRDALPALLKSAAKGSWDSREASLQGVAMLGDDRDQAAFDKLAQSEDKLTAEECKEDSDVAGCDKPGELAKKHQEVIQTFAKALAAGKDCKSDNACWVKHLDDAEGRVKERAALELGRSGKADMVSELLKHLHEPNLEARSAIIQAADWLVVDNKDAARIAGAQVGAIDKQIDDEHSKTEFVKVNEDLRRLAVDLKRRSV
jgi:HEAT repeat protein